MPSGFLVLADGRCLARHWSAYDQVIRAIADSIEPSPEGISLRDWLRAQIPNPQDEQELGYGAWLRTADNAVVVRHLDLRELTTVNQRLFHAAVLAAVRKLNESPEVLAWLEAPECLVDLGDMVLRADRNEPPLSRSDWREVVPSQGRQIGPGW